jgi:hypothetical protein
MLAHLCRLIPNNLYHGLRNRRQAQALDFAQTLEQLADLTPLDLHQAVEDNPVIAQMVLAAGVAGRGELLEADRQAGKLGAQRSAQDRSWWKVRISARSRGS